MYSRGIFFHLGFFRAATEFRLGFAFRRGQIGFRDVMTLTSTETKVPRKDHKPCRSMQITAESITDLRFF